MDRKRISRSNALHAPAMTILRPVTYQLGSHHPGVLLPMVMGAGSCSCIHKQNQLHHYSWHPSAFESDASCCDATPGPAGRALAAAFTRNNRFCWHSSACQPDDACRSADRVCQQLLLHSHTRNQRNLYCCYQSPTGHTLPATARAALRVRNRPHVFTSVGACCEH